MGKSETNFACPLNVLAQDENIALQTKLDFSLK